jgi:NitT/TauT family transport system ATP-binding protein
MLRTNSVISLQHVGMTFHDQNGRLDVLADIQADVRPREFLCVLGPSGCGKTTLLRLLAGLISPTGGKLVIPESHQLGIGLVFQQSNLMPWRTVLDNILLPLEMRGVPHAQALNEAQVLIELVGLEEFTDVWPAALSGGMAQRVAIARALIQDPDLLLLDEPFGSLDALTREKMGAELLRIWQVRRKTVVMITHSISEALLLADRVLVLSQRPARVLLEMDVDLPRPRGEDVQYTDRFQKMAKQIRSAIQ